MIPNTQLYHWLAKLVTPAQDLAHLSFCAGSRESNLHKWLQQLPLTQVEQISPLFYRALQEIGRLNTSPDQRLALLEVLREPVYQTLEALSQRYLNQPLILPEAALKTATLAQAIQKHLNNAYLAAVRDLCVLERKDLKDKQALAIHRVLTGLGMQLLRNYQLYIPVAGQVWTEIHTLYQLACELNVEQIPVAEPLPHHQLLNTIHGAYLRIVLLASTRTNQLRQDELHQCYNALEALVPAAELVAYSPTLGENLYLIVTDGNQPPVYKSRLSAEELQNQPQKVLELRTAGLLEQLQRLKSAPAEDLARDKSLPMLSPAMIGHLTQAWSLLTQRNFDRKGISGEIEVTVGLTNIHYHLAGETPFSVFLRQASSLEASMGGSIFQKHGAQLKTRQKLEDDPWADALDVNPALLKQRAGNTSSIDSAMLNKEKANYARQHPIFNVPLFDRSPGGFGLEWHKQVPPQLKAGELVGLREHGRSKWSIGVVRWVHQIREGTQMGVQVLAPQAIPVGLAVVHKTGGFSEYLRALQIPELRAVNQPPSLIANAISFHEYYKVRLYQQDQGEIHKNDLSLQLLQRFFGTGSFSQFAYRLLASTPAKPAADEDDFDSIWNT